MNRVNVLFARLRSLFGRKRQEAELSDEIRFHLEMQIEDNLARGMSPKEARNAALRSFGPREAMKETYRERSTFSLIETTLQDLRYALRTLAKNPGFTLASLAVLSLAIGANTAMFSVLNTVLLQPLPYRSPEHLAMLWTENPTQNLREGRSALWDVEQWRKQSESFEEIGAFDTLSTVLTTADGQEQILGASMSPNLLSLLGVQPILGRNLSDEEAEQQQSLVLISHRFWQTRFGGSQTVLGERLVLNGLSRQVIGVLPEGFQVARIDADVWGAHSAHRSTRGSENWFTMGRLRMNVSFSQAQAEMNAIAHRLNEGQPAAERERSISVMPLALYLVDSQTRAGLWLLGGTVFCVFLIAAANVTSLSLARSLARGREIAVRASLGASARRIVRQLLTESMLLAFIAGCIGTALAFTGIHLIRIFGPASVPRLDTVSLNIPAVLAAVAISLLVGLLVGLSSAMATVRRDLRPACEEGSRSVSGGLATSRIRRALVVADFALAIVLLAGAGLLIRSWWHVSSVDPGFQSDGVLLLDLGSPADVDTPMQRANIYQRILESVQSLPGVTHVGIIDDLFIENSRERVVTVERNDGAVSERLRFGTDEVSPDFFKAVGTPLLLGRFFTNSDAPDSPRVAIINQAMLRRYWPDADPMGRRIKLGESSAGNPWFTVVGVVEDMRRQGLERDPFPQMFVPLAQNGASRNVNLFVKSESPDPLAMATALRAAVRSVEKNALVNGVAPLRERVAAYLAQRRFQTSLLGGFSIVALLMAAIGIYGLIQYSITARTHEIGIRMAVGASTSTVFRIILAEGLRLSLVGLAIGMSGALWLGQLGASLLYGITATDPLAFAGASLLLIAVAITACYLPARRAMKIEPMVALALRQG